MRPANLKVLDLHALADKSKGRFADLSMTVHSYLCHRNILGEVAHVVDVTYCLTSCERGDSLNVNPHFLNLLHQQETIDTLDTIVDLLEIQLQHLQC